MTTMPPYPPDPREQARRARQEWRGQAAAQRQAVRAQRNYWRAMRRPSITGPVILIVIGVFALLVLSGKIDGAIFWMTYERWWPVLFIGVGLIMLLEWFLDRNQPYPVRRSTFGIIFLLCIAATAGTARWSHWNWGPLQDEFSGSDGFLHMMGAEHVNENQLDLPSPDGAAVQIDNPLGNVMISASSDTQMHVHARMTSYTNSDDDAKRYFESLQPAINVNGKNVTVHVAGNSNGKSDLTIELPPEASVSVTAGHGDISIEGLKGATNSTAVHGDIKLENLAASARARMNKGDFSAHAVQGDLTVEGRMDDVTLSEIRGKVLLDGEFFGDTHLERLASPLHFHSSRTEIDVARIAGDLTMDSGDLNLQQVQGPIKIVTRSKSIDCAQVFGDVHIENSDGDVTVTGGSPLGTVYINNRHGSINLGVPATENFTMDANAHNGEITSDFPLTSTGTQSSHVLLGQVGRGGTKVTLASDQGDIRLTKSDALPPLPPIPPLPPTVAAHTPAVPHLPKMPAIQGHARHLRAPQGVTEQPSVQ